ncbi:MAG: CapA family protein [Dehalococcoidia bacterium]
MNDGDGGLAAALQTLQTINGGLKLSVLAVPDLEALQRSGADFGVAEHLPGAPMPAGAIFVRRQPIALELPFTQSPDDLSLTQAVDIITGNVTNWAQVGGPAKAISLAIADAQQLVSVGALGGKPTAVPAQARAGTAESLLAEVDGGADELVVAPYPGLRLKSKAIRIDHAYPTDPDYPLTVDTIVLPAQRDGQQPTAQFASTLAAALARPHDGTATLDAVGDLMLARGVAATVARNGPDWPFGRVADRLHGADLRFGNLELALTDRGVQAHKDYTFRAPPVAAQSLASAAFNVVDLANNHVLDFGGQGLLDTIAALGNAGVLHVGAGADAGSARAPIVVTVNGLRIAWLAYVNVPDDSVTGFVARSLEAGTGRPGVAWGTADAIQRDVLAARQQADVVIVALHSGFEYTSEPNGTQRGLAHAAIDAGAALVLGAHPHVLQGIEYYKSGVIAYSLGNFVFDLDESDRTHLGMPSVLTVVLRVALDAHGVTGIELYPAIINSTDFRPEPVFNDAAKPVYDRIYRLTDALKSRP